MKTKKIIITVSAALLVLVVAFFSVSKLTSNNSGQGNLLNSNRQSVSIKPTLPRGTTVRLPDNATYISRSECTNLQKMIDTIAIYSGVGITPVLMANPSLADEVYSKVLRCNTAYPFSIKFPSSPKSFK